MSVDRNNATINQSLYLDVEFGFDRNQTLFDPDSFSKVEIQDNDGNVLETIATANINKTATGKYYIETGTSWNTISRTVIDRWFYTVDGVDYESEQYTFIKTSSSPSTGMASYIAITKLKVRDSKGTIAVNADYESYVNEAVKQYSRIRPDRAVGKLTGTGLSYLTVPSDFEEGFSQVINIEYPIDQQPMNYINKKVYKLENTDAGLLIRFLDSYQPALDENYYLRYMRRHVVDDSGSTIPVADKEAVCNLAASLACQSLAIYYANTTDPTMAADVVAYRSRGDELAARAKELKALYDGSIKPVTTGLIQDWDMASYWDDGTGMLNPEKHLI